jgi:hypothetical protein
MTPENMPKAILRHDDGAEEEIDDLPAYFFYLRRIAQRALKQFEEADELDAPDIKHVIEFMARAVAEKEGSR